MMLARIEPDSKNRDKHTFECANCGHELSEVVQFR
jgi:hypothetical protein